MNITPLFIVVGLGAVAFAVFNVLKKKFLSGKEVHPDVAIVAIMIGASIPGFLVDGFRGVPHLGIAFWLSFLGLIVCDVVIEWFHARALSFEDASIVVPLSSTMPLFLILTSWLMLGERVTSLGLVGIGLMGVGSFILNSRGEVSPLPERIQRAIPTSWHRRTAMLVSPWLRLGRSTGARYAIIVAWFGSISIVLDKIAVQNSDPMVSGSLAFLMVGVIYLAWSVVAGRWQKLEKRHFISMLGIGAILGISQIIVSHGYRFGPVLYVAAIKRTSILWTVLLAGWFLKEKHTRIRFVGAVIILVGVSLLAIK
jgi:uncharacterized membrane protein